MSNGARGAEYAARSNTSSSILGIAVSKVNRLGDTRITIMAGTVWGEERGKPLLLFGTGNFIIQQAPEMQQNMKNEYSLSGCFSIAS